MYALEATFLVQYSSKLVRMFALVKSGMSLKMGHVGSKTRSLGQILEKPFICSGCHIFSPTLLKIGQNVCLDNILDEFENESCWVKNRVNRSNVIKTLCMLWRTHFQSDTPKTCS